MKTKIFTFINFIGQIIKFLIIFALCMIFFIAGFYVIYGIAGYEISIWITNNFMHENIYFDNSGQTYVTYIPDWDSIIELLFLLLALITAFTIIVIMITSNIKAKRKVKKSIIKSAEMIHTYITTNDNSVKDIFPSEYIAIYEQMLEIKSDILQKEQILKDEATSKDNLIAYLAHDLKTPLTSIIGYLSLLEEIPDMPIEQRAKYLKISLDKAHRLEKLINEFFEITRYNLQQITLEKEQTNISYMLVQMTDEFYPILKENNNTINLQIDENQDIIANVDAIKLARVFNNILKNAIAYSYPNTEIKVFTQFINNNICISFQNIGNTIPEHKLDSIFEKFYRLDEARTTHTGGAGLGLAIAKEIVNLHNGTIKAISENNVTTFTVTLPINC